MAGRTQVELELIAITKEAQAALKKFSDESNKELSKITMATSFTAIVQGWQAVSGVASKALDIVKEGFSKAISEASAAEQANIKLANSMRLTSGFSKEAIEDFGKFASQLQKTTTFSTGTTTSALALAKSFQLSNAEAKRAVTISADVAAKLGEDLNTSVVRVSRTLQGFTDKELVKYVKGLKGISEEQKIAGQGLDLIEKSFKGSAAAITNSFQGALDQASNSFSDIFEEFGKGVLSAPEVVAGIKSIGAQFGVLAAAIAQAAPSIAKFTGDLLNFAASAVVVFLKFEKAFSTFIGTIVAGYQYIYGILGQFKELIVGFFEFVVTSSEKGTKRIQGVFDNIGGKLNPMRLIEGIIGNKSNVDKAFDPLIKGAEKFKKDLATVQKAAESQTSGSGIKDEDAAKYRLMLAQREKLLNEWNSQKKEIELASLNDIDRINKEFYGKEELVRRAFAAKFISTETEKNRIIEGLERERLKRISDANEQALLKLATQNSKFASDTANALGDAYRKGSKVTEDQGIAAGAGIIASVLKGAEGARQAIGAIAGAVANYFIPGIGAVVDQIVQGLSKGPEFVRQMITDFEKQVPELLVNIVEGIVEAFATVTDNIPMVIEGIFKALPRIVTALVNYLSGGFIINFIKAIPAIIKALVMGIIKGIPEIIKAFANGIIDAAKGFVKALIDALTDVGGALGGKDGKGGGLGGVVRFGADPLDLGGKLGIDDWGFNPTDPTSWFAKGGRVPDSPKYRGDKYPAMLDAGEQVFSRDLTKKLEKALEGGGLGGDVNVTAHLVMDRKVLATEMFKIRRAGYQT